jgi:hypothetical protein
MDEFDLFVHDRLRASSKAYDAKIRERNALVFALLCGKKRNTPSQTSEVRLDILYSYAGNAIR